MKPLRTCVLAASILTLTGDPSIRMVAPVQAAETPFAGRASYLNSPQAKKLGLPFSEAVRAGGLLFLAGQIGNVPGESGLIAGGITAESRQAMRNVQQVLERYGSALRDVIKCTVFLADMSEWSQFNSVYREFFQAPYPARSAVGVNGLAFNARVEIECIAYVAN